MAPLNTFDLKPTLVLSETDHKQLTILALAGLNTSSDIAEDLLSEIERAHIVPEKDIPGEVVRMGSSVTYRPDNGAERTVTLVYPADADISQGRVSVLTPIGTALIGLAQGQSITWVARDGKKHALTVLSVKQPE